MPKKNVIVNRRFLNELANEIYDPKTRKFLRLCDGKLQNGPDPTDDERPMHCGLGELYFAMTDRQPSDDKVTEGDVVDLAVELSPLPDEKAERKRQEKELQQAKKRAVAVIKALKLPSSLEAQLVVDAEEYEADEDEEGEEETLEAQFRSALDDIPGANDDSCGDSCDYDKFRKRSVRVAHQLRAAAELLPS